jgi:hypothetical protein
MTLEEAKNSLLKEIKTPDGIFILYGISLIPEKGETGFGLITYSAKGIRDVYWNIDCEIIKT